MVCVVVAIRVKDGKVSEFVRIFRENLPNVHAEDGCIEYFPALDVDSPLGIQDKDAQVVTILEKWESMAHLEAHSKAPHMVTYRERVKDLVEGMTAKVVEAA